MSTRSNIGFKKENGNVEVIYCHYDGYIDGVGNILKEHYYDEDKINDLINLGDISYLGSGLEASPVVKRFGFNWNWEEDFKILDEQEKFELSNQCHNGNYTVAYGRDRGENDTQKSIYESVEKFILNACPHMYIYLYEDNEWKVLRGKEFGAY